jgi:phosphohistidine phosphatase SixA
MSSDRLTEIERAFELARSGGPNSIDDIRRQLTTEGYSTARIAGKTLSKQLKAIMLAARTPKTIGAD